MSTGSTQPFRPAGTAAAAASTTARTVVLAGGRNAVLVYNATASTAFFRLGGATGLTATTSDTPVPAGMQMLVGGGAVCELRCGGSELWLGYGLFHAG